MNVQGGQVTSVEGQGRFAESLRRSFEEHRDIKSPRLPGSGINWWTTPAIGTSPKGRIAASFAEMSGSGRMHAWGAGHSRSGVIHTSVGEGVVSDDWRIIRHVNLCFPTLVCDGKKIIDRGRLTTLDDPEIVKLAERYGDPVSGTGQAPAQLLTEDWIPAISGVNAP